MKKIWFYIMICVLMGIFMFKGSFNEVMAQEKDRVIQNRYYTSVKVKAGDTLWDLAEKYSKDCETEIEDYIEELKMMNSLKGDDIHMGQYLTIVYYAE